MNSRIIFAFGIIALNGAMWFWFARDRSPQKGEMEKTLPEPRMQVVQTSAPPVVVVQTNQFRWQQLESEDYKTYIARLRSIGCPEETIRDIVIADLEKLLAPRIRMIDGRTEPPRYWKPDRKELVGMLESIERQEQKLEVDFRKREIIQELLGIDLAAERARLTGEHDFYGERLAFLSPEKAMRARMIIERANREEIQLREKSWLAADELTAEEKQKLRELQAKKESEIAALLTPEEKQRYDLWFSPSAYRVREGFLAMEPTEQDFLALYQIQRQFDEQWAGVERASLPWHERMELEQAEKAREEAFRDYLGEERYENFSRSLDPDFQQLQATAAEYGLDSAVASRVHGFKQALKEQWARIEQAPSFTTERRNELRAALADETERSVVEVMGPAAYRHYVRSGAAEWIWK